MKPGLPDMAEAGLGLTPASSQPSVIFALPGGGPCESSPVVESPARRGPSGKEGGIWEKTSDNGDIHDKDAKCNWGSSFISNPYPPNGTAYTVFLAALNGASGGNCFTQKFDWRLPLVDERSGLIDLSQDAPKTLAIFKAGAIAGCTATSNTCSSTVSGNYWSSPPGGYATNMAW